MMISSKGRYALRVMIDLAEHAEEGSSAKTRKTAGRCRCGRGSTGRSPITSAATRSPTWRGWKRNRNIQKGCSPSGCTLYLF